MTSSSAAVVGLARRPDVAGALSQQRAAGGRGPLFVAAACRAAVDVRGWAAARQRRVRSRDRRRLQGTGPEPVEQQPGRIRDRPIGPASHAGMVPGSRALPIRRLRNLDAAGDGIRGSFRGAGARDWRRDGNRPLTVRQQRCDRHRRRSLWWAPADRAGELPVARAHRPVRAPSHQRGCCSWPLVSCGSWGKSGSLETYIALAYGVLMGVPILGWMWFTQASTLLPM